MNITSLGEAKHPSPIGYHVDERVRVPWEIRTGVVPVADGELAGLAFELAGPRSRLCFEPARTCAGIVTCGGLCPGLNNVIRSAFLELHHGYGVPRVLGFRNGYAGLDPSRGYAPLELGPELVDDIHREGGTILGTSRGPVDPAVAVDFLVSQGVNLLITVGGDGTLRGGNRIHEEARRRGVALSVVGVPKTVDNDVAFVSRTFGYYTAVEETAKVLECAHMEAHSVENGVSVVKVMGRHAGFIAAGATVASQDVNFCLIPEVPFRLEGEGGFLAALKRRLVRRGHAVIVVAEGAGPALLAGEGDPGKDASGNTKLRDIGTHLRDRIDGYLKAEKMRSTVRYFDPSYIVRSVPADAEDAILCDLLARHAVHAGMAGKTGLVVGTVHDEYVHVPIGLLAQRRRVLEPEGASWRAVLAATGQPARFE